MFHCVVCSSEPWKPSGPQLSQKQYNKLPTDSYDREIPLLCFIAWCAVVSRETLVKRCIFLWRYLVLLPLPLPEPHDNMLPDHHTAIYLLWENGKMVDSNSGAQTDSLHIKWRSDDSQMNSQKPTRQPMRPPPTGTSEAHNADSHMTLRRLL